MSPVPVWIACALLGLASAGCGAEVPTVDRIAGSQVGAMAERELEAENPGLAAGTLSCPHLDFRVGASVRCLRTTTLSGGRVVKIGGTVRVTSLTSGGRLHVAMDKVAAEFGVSGQQLATDLRGQYRRLFHRRPGTVDCPYLRGRVGVTVTCHVQVGGAQRLVDAAVTHVDAEQYDVRYAFRSHRASPAVAS